MDTWGGPTSPRSSLSLQILLWLDGWLTMILSALVLALLMVKPFFLPYPPGAASEEFALMLFHIPLQAARNWVGTAGNKRERSGHFVLFHLFTVWTALVTGHFWRLQVYGLRLECRLAATLWGLALAETLWGIVVGIRVCEGGPEYARVLAASTLAIGAFLIVIFTYIPAAAAPGDAGL